MKLNVAASFKGKCPVISLVLLPTATRVNNNVVSYVQTYKMTFIYTT